MKDLVDILPDYADKVGNMNAKVLAARDAESASYAHYMAKMLQVSEAQREENRKLAEIRKQRHGIDPHAQQPSTLAIMARPKEDDEKHWLRHLPEGAQIRDKDGNVNIGERAVTIEEISHVEATRRRPKNSQGQSELSATTEEKKEASVNAFICSPPARLSPEEIQKVSQIAPYTPPPPIPPKPERPKTLASRFVHWLWKRDVRVDKLTKKELKVEEADK